jgi:putative ABC transport system permease protein
MLDTYFEPEMFYKPARMYLQPVKDVHLHSNHIKFQINNKMGNSKIILVFVVVALLTILIACINFINLAIARSVKRAKEVGIRKVLGANRSKLVYQFLGESIIITLIAILLSLVLVELALPEFNRILDTELVLSILGNPLLNIGLVLIWLAVSLLSGIYPAIFMSRYKAVEVLKGVSAQSARAKGWLGKTLVVFQFSVATVLIFVVIVTNRQVNYVLNKDLGYNYENVLGVSIQGGNVAEKVGQLRARFSALPGVTGFAAASNINGVSGNQSTITVDDSTETRITVRFGYVDEDFFPLMGIRMLEGRNFSRDYPNDDVASIILNQAAVDFLGWENPIGKRFMPLGMDTADNRRTVIGVINDYHYYSVHSRIEPAAYIIRPFEFGMACIKFDGQSGKEMAALAEEVWMDMYPSSPYNWVLASERLERQYAGDRNTLRVFIMFTVLSILISAMGLYGLTAINVEQRTREIGIRKVLGGSVGQLMKLIFKEFVILILIAGLIALPVGYYFSLQFLDQFAFSIPISWYYAVIAIGASLLIATLTIVYHASKAAALDPVDSLKYE